MSVHLLVATDRTDRFAPSLAHLRDSGARVTLVSPGAATVVAGTQLSHDLAIIDSDHPRSCRTVLLLSQLPGPLPVVVLTDEPGSPSADRCLVAGALDVLRWNGSPERLAENILDASTGVHEGRRRQIATRRRHALARIAATEAHRPVRNDIRLTNLERREARPSPTDHRSDRFRGMGPAQERVAQGLKDGRSCTELARDAEVTTSAIYQAKRRLARRVGVAENQLVEWLQSGVLPIPVAVSSTADEDRRPAPEPLRDLPGSSVRASRRTSLVPSRSSGSGRRVPRERSVARAT